MANDNCLSGLRCPNCGSYEPLKIVATCTVTVYDDGTDEAGGYEWDSDSSCSCPQCIHVGTVADFQDVDNDGRFKECKLCDNTRNIDNMHLHQDEWICEDCWDERLRTTE